VWPHTISIGLNGRAISIGTDAHEVIARLEPWRIEDLGEPTDYCLELHPAEPGGGRPQPLPGLYHGSTALLRSRDNTRLTTAFLRVLASHGRPAAEGQVRVRLMPVVRNGAAILAPPASVAALPDRWLLAQGFDVVHTASSLIDARTATVLVDPPLGSDETVAIPFDAWWLPPRHSEEPLSPGFAVAEVMTLVENVTPASAGSTLRAVASLVERAHPTFTPAGIDPLKEALVTATAEPAGR
jgi:hypothetical protein